MKEKILNKGKIKMSTTTKHIFKATHPIFDVAFIDAHTDIKPSVRLSSEVVI